MGRRCGRRRLECSRVITSSRAVVADLDVVGIAVLEPKADTPLVADRDRELAGSTPPSACSLFPGGTRREFDLLGRVDRSQFAQHSPRDIWGLLSLLAGHVELLGLFVRERLDHKLSVLRHVTRSNRRRPSPESLSRPAEHRTPWPSRFGNCCGGRCWI